MANCTPRYEPPPEEIRAMMLLIQEEREAHERSKKRPDADDTRLETRIVRDPKMHIAGRHG